MLVLSRQKDQTIIIGDDVEVTVVDIRGDKVRLGINAPRQVTVHRKEVYEAVKREHEGANARSPEAGTEPHAGNGGDPFMHLAVEEAKAGLSEGGLPIGAVLVRGGEVIGRGHCRRVQKNNPTAYAEIDCLANAGRQKSYKDTVLYSTLMPCHLSSGAIVQFGIPKVVVGDSARSPGAADFLRKHGVQIIDLRDAECTALTADFVRTHPELWSESAGK